VVVQQNNAARRGRFILAGVLLVNAALAGLAVYEPVKDYLDVRHLVRPSSLTTRAHERDPNTLIEANLLTEGDRNRLREWLAQNGQDPVEYAVTVARQHQVTIFGELHDWQDNLQLLIRALPQLYHRAGVRCLGMEVCNAQDNEMLKRLVTGETYDRALALEIARRQSWELWGSKDYWDVLEAVWQLNHSLPKGAEKMDLFGLSFRFDGPSLMLLNVGDVRRPNIPLWEKLRFWRAAKSLFYMVIIDDFYARSVEKQIFEKGRRGIVWVGMAHAPLDVPMSVVAGGKVIRQIPRMGFLLRQKYGDRVGQVLLHTRYGFSRAIADLVEQIAKPPVAFDVEGSPFAELRDSKEALWFSPGVSFSDLAGGYIYLNPQKKMTKCRWLEGYISGEMFGRNKPLYEAIARQPFTDAAAANRLFAEYWSR
jgi:hypothetical protein